MTETIATEQLLATWREAERRLEEADPFLPGRAELEARVEKARLTYLAHVDELRGTQEEPNGLPA